MSAHKKPKPKGRSATAKPPARSGCSPFGCLLSLLLFPIVIPLAVIVWCAVVLTGGLAKAAFTPPKGGD